MTHVLNKTGLGGVGYLSPAVSLGQIIYHFLVALSAALQSYYLSI